MGEGEEEKERHRETHSQTQNAMKHRNTQAHTEVHMGNKAGRTPSPCTAGTEIHVSPNTHTHTL